MSPKAATKSKQDDLVEVLISQGYLSEDKAEQIGKQAREKSTSVFDYLKDENIIDEPDLIKSASVLFGLSRIKLSEISIDKETLNLISQKLAREYRVVPFEKKGKGLKMALANPYRLPKIDEKVLNGLKEKGYQISFYLTTENDLKQGLNQYNEDSSNNESKKIEVEENRKKTSPAAKKRDRLLEILITQGVLKADKAEKYEQVAKEQKRDLVELLMEKGVGETAIQRARAQKNDLPFTKIDKGRIEKEAVKRIPYEIAQKYDIAAYNQTGERVIDIAVIDPEQKALSEIIDFAKSKKGIDIKMSLTTKEDLEKILVYYPQHKKEEKKSVPKPKKSREEKGKEREGKEKTKKESEEKTKKKGTTVSETGPSAHKELKGRIGSLLKEKVDSKDDLDKIINGGSVPRIVAGVINFALTKRASDVHIQPSEGDTTIRFRIDGILSDITTVPKDLHAAIISRIKILAKLKIDEKRKPQDGRFNIGYKNKEIDLRVSCLPTNNDEKIVLRILDKSKKKFDLEKLGIKGSSFKKLVKNIEKPYGMIVATGPTGSGKSTTLYASMSRINKPEINIITLEDPIEYELNGISQSQARPDIGFSFSNGLRSVLRQDPDVIMVGEIRDKETAEMSIHAALTGHLLFTTLHTNDAAGAIPRLIDMGIEPFLIGSAANAFLAQRLVRKICPHCKQEDPNFDQQKKKKIKEVLKDLPESEKKAVPSEKDWKLYKGKGCDECHQGYKGRVGIFEVLDVSENIKRNIRKDTTISEIRKQAIKEGMVTMQQDGVIKALKGETTLEEIFRVIVTEEEQF